MRMRSTIIMVPLAGVVALALGCGGGDEGESLREQLARLPQDTTPTPAESAAERASLPLDTTFFGLPSVDPPADTVPLTIAVVEPIVGPDRVIEDDDGAGPVTPADTAPGPLRPGPPQDTEPWIPLRNPITLSEEWTEAPVTAAGPGGGMTTLESVRAARNDGFDRIVLEFRAGARPGYRVEYVDPPVRQCGSGQAVPLTGEAWLRVRLEPSRAHDDRGRPTVTERSRITDLPLVRAMQLICDYEGQVEWVISVDAPNRFRVTELSNPARVVVDILH